MPFPYFVIQFILKHLEKNYDLIIRLFDIIVHYMNELALKSPLIYWGVCESNWTGTKYRDRYQPKNAFRKKVEIIFF